MNSLIGCNCKLAERMRLLCPLPGNEYRKLVMVELSACDIIGEHKHKGHTVLYYPMDSSPIEIAPTAGTTIYIPPGTRHWVPPVDADRISFAMIVDDPE